MGEVGGRALENNATTLLSSARTEFYYIVSGTNDIGVVLNDIDRVAMFAYHALPTPFWVRTPIFVTPVPLSSASPTVSSFPSLR